MPCYLTWAGYLIYTIELFVLNPQCKDRNWSALVFNQVPNLTQYSLSNKTQTQITQKLQLLIILNHYQ